MKRERLKEPTRAELIDRLAESLVFKMEHLDARGKDWDSLTGPQKTFYRSCVEYMMLQDEAAAFLRLPETTRYEGDPR